MCDGNNFNFKDNIFSFKEILLELLCENNLSQAEFSRKIGIPKTTISGWLNAERLPDYHALRKMARFFDVSADYLLDLDGNRQ
ncbi:MAG: helix-turn-helix domain-containing protein [Firmicutes bacterium]|nr:helix-turn-helix domain-containing protein [Bacillota bacterium]